MLLVREHAGIPIAGFSNQFQSEIWFFTFEKVKFNVLCCRDTVEESQIVDGCDSLDEIARLKALLLERLTTFKRGDLKEKLIRFIDPSSVPPDPSLLDPP